MGPLPGGGGEGSRGDVSLYIDIRVPARESTREDSRVRCPTASKSDQKKIFI